MQMDLSKSGAIPQRGSFADLMAAKAKLDEKQDAPPAKKQAAPQSFHDFHALGYTRLVPIMPPRADVSERSSLHKRVGTRQDARGKSPGVRGRDGKWFGFDWVPYQTDERDLDRWAAMGAGIGIKTGHGLIAIDADTTNETFARTIRDVVDQQFGRLPIRVGRYPKALYLCRVSGDLPYQRVEFGPRDERGNAERVEILSDRKQFVAHGTHPVTGKPYEWTRPLVSFDDLPVFTPVQIGQLMEKLRSVLPDAGRVITEGAGADVDQISLKGSLEHVRKAVGTLPNTSDLFPSREHYRDIGYAIKAALPEHEAEAFEIFADWCARWQEGTNEPDVIAADWSRMKPPYRRGASWLYELAEQHGSGFSRADIWFDDEQARQEENPFAEIQNREKVEKPPLKLVSFQDVAAMDLATATNPLVKGLIDQGAFSVLYGESNTGKTFVAMDLAFHIATGLPWDGLKVAAVPVVYVAAEGSRGVALRAKALQQKFPQQAANAQFHLLLSSVDLFRKDEDLAPLIEAVRAHGAEFVVLDTLSRVLAGGDENSSTDMGALVRNIDALRQATRAHVMAIHHTGKNRDRGARGHSLLRAAIDTEIEIADDTITVTKQRDMDKSYSRAFVLEPVTLYTDADGEAVTSCTIRLVSKRELPPGEVTAAEKLIVDTMLALEQDEGRATFKAKEIADYLDGDGDPKREEAVRSRLRAMAEKRVVERAGRGLWRLKPVEKWSTGLLDEEDENAPANKEAVETGREGQNVIFQ